MLTRTKLSLADTNPEMPLWLRTERHLWTEDDATRHDRSAERVYEAWIRLFGCELPSETPVAKYDGGDTFFTLYASGRVHTYSFDGDGIGVARFIEVVRGA